MDEWGQSRGEEKKNERKDRGVGRAVCLILVGGIVLTLRRQATICQAGPSSLEGSGNLYRPLIPYIAHLRSLIDKGVTVNLPQKLLPSRYGPTPSCLS